MSTQNRIEINRENAKHSTGPKTEAGKKRSSLNALRHGLTSQIVVMPSEDLDAYRSHVKSFNDEYHPQGATEAHLVQALADASWRLNRVAALETNVLTLSLARHSGDLADAPPEVQDALAVAASMDSQAKALATLGMQGQRLSRQFEKTVTQLHDLQKTRLEKEARELNELVDIIQMYK